LLEDTSLAMRYRTEAAYRLGRVFHVQEQWDRALEAYAFAAQHPVDKQAKWSPWAQYYLGELYERAGKIDQAREAYQPSVKMARSL